MNYKFRYTAAINRSLLTKFCKCVEPRVQEIKPHLVHPEDSPKPTFRNPLVLNNTDFAAFSVIVELALNLLDFAHKTKCFGFGYKFCDILLVNTAT